MADTPSAPAPAARAHLNRLPKQDCDLIMKGGVTSGIVYPPGVLELCQKYRFHSIGGASAGAIAAAAAAAAEYGRQNPPPNPSSSYGFVRLAEMNDELAQPGFVKNLFRPSPEGAPLLEAFLQWTRTTPKEGAPHTPGLIPRLLVGARRVGSVLEHSVKWQSRFGGLMGLLVMALIASGVCVWGVQWLLTPGPGPRLWGALLLLVWLMVCAVGCALGGIIGGLIAFGRILARLQDKGQHKYGICPGSDGPRARLEGGELALTDWLHVRLNQLAGRAPSDPSPTLSELRAQGIHFKLVTSNLTLGQPYILPMRRGSRSFYCRKSEMERLFPAPVIQALVKWSEQESPSSAILLRDEDAQEFLRFPMGEDLPLVVATRMSLSFPVLLSAVRIYSIRSEAYLAYEKDPSFCVDLSRHVEEHWLSDGGIASNFPIHVFDSWVPERPTFGITLYDSPLTKVLEQRELDSPVLCSALYSVLAARKVADRIARIPAPEGFGPAGETTCCDGGSSKCVVSRTA